MSERESDIGDYKALNREGSAIVIVIVIVIDDYKALRGFRHR